jgi:methyltransferase-like protein/2-polyprenyl-3-methyl-5-hydroxy-6-metoxy-1,4-benzoquinol methylase
VPSSSYDEVPYSKKPYPQSHPDRLAVLATLFGMHPAPIDRCRVLELGGGSGGNIIPMAYSLPGSQFLGAELSARQVADGQATIKALGLRNVEIRQQDILGIGKDLGTFDYIVAHGVYSWVPDPVREKLLQICRENLSPNGVAYVSYNTYPGWNFRGMVREMVRYHTREIARPAQRIARARELLGFFAQSAPADNPYQTALKSELELWGRYADSELFHEHLEDINEPTWFYQFADRAERHGLQFLAEADFSAMQPGIFPPEVGEKLGGITDELIKTEQFMDILRYRRFRQSLLCKKEIVLERNLAPQSIMGFEIASAARPLSPGVFQIPNGGTFTSTDPRIRAAFSHLSEIWPQSVSFDGLVQAAGLSNPDAQTLAAQILEGYARSFVVLRSRKAPFVTAISERPESSALARHQAKSGDPVVNQLHESGLVDDFDRHLLQLLDGTNDRKAMVDRLVKLVENGVLRSSSPDIAALRRNLARAVEDDLGHFTKLALLVG